MNRILHILRGLYDLIFQNYQTIHTEKQVFEAHNHKLCTKHHNSTRSKIVLDVKKFEIWRREKHVRIFFFWPHLHLKFRQDFSQNIL